MKIECYSFFTNSVVEYSALTKRELALNASLTYGKKYDRVEGEMVEGIVPLSFNRISPMNPLDYPSKEDYKRKALDSPVRET